MTREKKRLFKLFYYMATLCISLYSVSRIVSPILELKESFGADGNVSTSVIKNILFNLLPGNTEANLEQYGIEDDIINKLPFADNPQLQGQLQRYQLANNTGAQDTQPVISVNKNIVVQDIRNAELDPELEKELSRSAVVLHAQGKLEEAIAVYLTDVGKNPRDAAAFSNLALAYYQTGQYTDAWEAVFKAEDLGRVTNSEFRSKLTEKMAEPIR